MKYIVFLIATAFLIEINLSDAAVPRGKVVDNAGTGAVRRNGSGPKGSGRPGVSAGSGDGDRGRSSPSRSTGSPKARRAISSKPAAGNAANSQQRNEKFIQDFMKTAAPLNPANLVTALKGTGTDQIKNAIPLLDQIVNTVKGTGLEPIFSNLKSALLVQTNLPQYWNSVYDLLPNFLSSIENASQLFIGTGAVALGRGVKTVVDLTDNVTSTVADVVSQVPGGALLHPVLGLVTGPVNTGMDILDAIGESARVTGKSARAGAQEKIKQRRIARSLSLANTVPILKGTAPV